MINSETQLIALIGHPVIHSKSPQMHNVMFEKLGLNYRYIAFDVKKEQLEQAITGIKALNIRGLNVTIPHKVNVMRYLDEISSEAKEIGAVNTIVNQNGILIGYNTDGEGYVRSLIEETGVKLAGKMVLLLGAGGAARAIGVTLSKHSLKEIVIVNRDIEKAKELQRKLGKNIPSSVITTSQIKYFIDKIDIIINTTSVGMYPNTGESLIKQEWISSNHIISDIVYNPIVTQLILDGHQKGAKIHSGLGMFVYQGVIAFEKWTGITPDPRIMRETVLDLLTIN
ncbi:shikimate dehydrogenase [Vulcanibacillus modesticaldus]|uniref:Shikimate dehydrogenase (NADP(+)) n=1 Tax=Vulcanibacillus modesticaldus TaxID=337097 RepID=A0A1D2YTM8_9BACI|nr:shikimate dehydrogenase [Vulcanibacillus modesticaldus]OEF99011.1 shikimate dehydrogenase [Vulcanibacillus modesticaldus]